MTTAFPRRSSLPHVVSRYCTRKNFPFPRKPCPHPVKQRSCQQVEGHTCPSPFLPTGDISEIIGNFVNHPHTCSHGTKNFKSHVEYVVRLLEYRKDNNPKSKTEIGEGGGGSEGKRKIHIKSLAVAIASNFLLGVRQPPLLMCEGEGEGRIESKRRRRG